MGPMLTGKQWYDNPYGGPAIQQSTGPAVIWVNRHGEEAEGTRKPDAEVKTFRDAGKLLKAA